MENETLNQSETPAKNNGVQSGVLGSKNLWVFLSPRNILHAYHPKYNSITACGADWDGYNYRPHCNPELFRKCKNCMRKVGG